VLHRACPSPRCYGSGPGYDPTSEVWPVRCRLKERSPEIASPPVSELARRKKLEFFFARIDPAARILDLGCADGWVGRWAAEHGYTDVTGVDVVPPADVVGDIRNWEALGLQAHSFDVVIAFEVVEHGDYADAIHDLLKPDGRLMATTPVPRFDWVCRIAEGVGLFQKRTSPHAHLIDLRLFPQFDCVERVVRGGIAQWAVLRPRSTA
jgi:SAM-dependent methyltransferase